MWSAVDAARAEEALGRARAARHSYSGLNDTIRPLADPARVSRMKRAGCWRSHMGVHRVVVRRDRRATSMSSLGEYADGVARSRRRFPWARWAAAALRHPAGRHSWSPTIRRSPPHTAGRDRLAAGQRGRHWPYLCPLARQAMAASSTSRHPQPRRRACGHATRSRSPRTWPIVSGPLWSIARRKRTCARRRSGSRFCCGLNDALRPLIDPAAVQQTAARLLGEHLRIARVAYADFEVGGTYVHTARARAGRRSARRIASDAGWRRYR
jgi:hypothetical protein